MDALTPGARAALELSLSDARGDLARAIEERNRYTGKADEHRALAAEAELCQARVSHNAQAIKFRLRAVEMDPDIAGIQTRIAQLEGMLKGAPAQVASVVLPAAAVAGVDSTMGALA